MNFHLTKQDSSKKDPVMTTYSPLDEYSTNIGTMNKNYTFASIDLSKAFGNVDTSALVWKFLQRKVISSTESS
jgi:hypothetical protein